MGWIGYGNAAQAPGGSGLIPLTMTRAEPYLFLRILHTLVLDDEGKYLTVTKSVYEVSAGDDSERTLFHYDYIRGAAKWP